MDFDNKYEQKPNTAKVFVENGLFSKAGVEALMAVKKPIIKLKVNFDGVEKEIALYFDMVWENDQPTNQVKLTKTGNKMLSGKVVDPYVANQTQSMPPPISDAPFDDDIPF
jgi:hypothetical protein